MAEGRWQKEGKEKGKREVHEFSRKFVQ